MSEKLRLRFVAKSLLLNLTRCTRRWIALTSNTQRISRYWKLSWRFALGTQLTGSPTTHGRMWRIFTHKLQPRPWLRTLLGAGSPFLTTDTSNSLISSNTLNFFNPLFLSYDSRYGECRRSELRSMRSSGTEEDFTVRQDLLTQITTMRADDREVKTQAAQSQSGPAKEIASQALERLRQKQRPSTSPSTSAAAKSSTMQTHDMAGTDLDDATNYIDDDDDLSQTQTEDRSTVAQETPKRRKKLTAQQQEFEVIKSMQDFQREERQANQEFLKTLLTMTSEIVKTYMQRDVSRS
jgi:hypothetical protein